MGRTQSAHQRLTSEESGAIGATFKEPYCIARKAKKQNNFHYRKEVVCNSRPCVCWASLSGSSSRLKSKSSSSQSKNSAIVTVEYEAVVSLKQLR
jgi:hypothetical protein